MDIALQGVVDLISRKANNIWISDPSVIDDSYIRNFDKCPVFRNTMSSLRGYRLSLSDGPDIQIIPAVFPACECAILCKQEDIHHLCVTELHGIQPYFPIINKASYDVINGDPRLKARYENFVANKTKETLHELASYFDIMLVKQKDIGRNIPPNYKLAFPVSKKNDTDND